MGQLAFVIEFKAAFIGSIRQVEIRFQPIGVGYFNSKQGFHAGVPAREAHRTGVIGKIIEPKRCIGVSQFAEYTFADWQFLGSPIDLLFKTIVVDAERMPAFFLNCYSGVVGPG